jgi:hypothetical protein
MTLDGPISARTREVFSRWFSFAVKTGISASLKACYQDLKRRFPLWIRGKYRTKRVQNSFVDN